MNDERLIEDASHPFSVDVNNSGAGSLLIQRDSSHAKRHYQNVFVRMTGGDVEDNLIRDAICSGGQYSNRWFYSTQDGRCDKYSHFTYRDMMRGRTKSRGEGVDDRDMELFSRRERPILIPGQPMGGLDEVCRKLRGRRSYFDPNLGFCSIRDEILPLQISQTALLENTREALRNELGFERTSTQRIGDRYCEVFRWPYPTDPRKAMLLMGIESLLSSQAEQYHIQQDTQVSKLAASLRNNRKAEQSGILARMRGIA
ncbi:unnamed protein product [Vitrella brassicaformis CCMP3155]|uniref:Uncharacterized protein n=1 Tax=Vitrella brassicaformis (strain CCMP3155) TaxID=1169540 RepID=A0A0G4EPX5_VITBC|nr:unnamed protein product [Vitrella brassicaformis CCMP3155]|eukprot:CEL99905.1 unnamed protein product [Vitrella brassicaformis CCMP3155]